MPDKLIGFTQSSYPASVSLCPPMRITKLLFCFRAAKVGRFPQITKRILLFISLSSVSAPPNVSSKLSPSWMYGEMYGGGLQPMYAPIGKTLDYAYKLWPRLRRYVLDGRYYIDNNPVERAQRPSVMGRKKCPFKKSDCGAVDSAIFYFLLKNCDIVGMSPCNGLPITGQSTR